AMRLVERVGDSDAVAEIHAAQQAGLSEATPRLQRILGGVVPLKPRVPEPAASGTTLVAAVREDVEIRQRLVSALGGLADEDQMPIGASDQVPVHRSIDQRPDHMLLQAQLAFANLQRVLAADEVWGLVLRSAHMLPALQQARAQKPRKNTAKALAKSGLEALDALLLETLAAAITVGSAHVVHEGSHLLALVRAMRAAFGLGPAAATSGAAVASIVDDCRNVTVMREVVDAMRRRKEQVPPRLTAWPAHIAGDGLLGPSAMAWPQPSPSGSPVLGMRSGLRGSPVLGALPVPDVDTQLEPHFERAVDGKQVTAAWDAQEAVTGGWEPPDGALPAILPQNWVVCGLSIDQQRDVLFVTRYVHGRQPAVLCLPMRGAAEPQSDSGLSDSGPAPGRSVFDSTYRQLRGIIAQSDETMKTGSACTTEGEKRAWWEHRTSLDRQLGELLTSIEDEWLGGFRSVLEPTDTSCTDAESLRASIGHCVVSSLPKSYATKAKAMELSAELCALVHGVARRTVCRAGAEDGDSSSAAENDWLDVCSLLWDVYFYQGAAPPSDEDGLGLFAARLAGALKAGAAAADVCTSVGEGARPHLLLVLDKHAQQIPWECLPCIRDYSVSRVPSVTILRERILAMRADTARGSRPRPDMSAPGGLLAFSSLGGLGPGPNLLSSLVFDSPPRDRGGCGEAGPGKPPGAHVDGTSVFYVLNPEGDLHRTQ
ncbi:separin protein, partial [Coemansia spiralis]